jgi:hypothetical protein
MPMTELISLVLAGLGIGGAVVSIYMKFTISDTIISRLDDRYVGAPLCEEKHTGVAYALEKLERRSEKLELKMDHNFELLRTLLGLAQTSRERIAIADEERSGAGRE